MLPLKYRIELLSKVSEQGFSFIPHDVVRSCLTMQSKDALTDWDAFMASWNDMPIDQYMADGGKYRRRRYAVLSSGNVDLEINVEPHQPHYQSLFYNQLNGGVAREFEPILKDILHGSTMQNIIKFGLNIFHEFKSQAKWHIECHQFRIEANQTIGKPTPEGIHRDGVDFVLVMMVKRQNISSGTTTMHDLTFKKLDSFTLREPLDIAIVDDRRCMHGVTPIEPINNDIPAYRDVLVVTYRVIS